MPKNPQQKQMIETCNECGDHFTIYGINSWEYSQWKMYGQGKLIEKFTELSPLQHDQLVEGLCNTCMYNMWT